MMEDDDNEDGEELIPYREFRTGETFATVYTALREEARRAFEDEGRRMFITRHTILGRWHEIKVKSYSAYVRYFQKSKKSKNGKHK